MRQDELYEEYRQLKQRTDALEAEHRLLIDRPEDVEAHREHAARLREHIKRLHEHMEARGMRVPNRAANPDRDDA